MGLDLKSEVLAHIARVRENPALAVSPEELEKLEHYVRLDRERSFAAKMSPEAVYTWTSRVELDATVDQSEVDTINDFGAPVEIVGFVPTVLALEATPKVVPPIEAFDVQIFTDRGARDLITAANTPVSGGPERPQFAGLASVSATIANRLYAMELGMNGSPATMGFIYRWTVDAATRAALGWANVQLSMNVMYNLVRRGRGSRR